MVTAVVSKERNYPAGTLLAFLHYRSRGLKTTEKPDISRGRFVKLVKAVANKGFMPPAAGCYFSHGTDPVRPERLIIEAGGQFFTDANLSIFQNPSPDEVKETIKLRRDRVISGMVHPNVTGPTGSDPEMFVLNGEGEVIPAYKFLPDKTQPLIYPGAYGGRLFWDGFQAEFTTTQANCHAYFVDYIRRGMIALLKEAKKVDEKARLTTKCVVDITKDMLAIANPQAAALGCEPSLNAYKAAKPPALVECDPTQLLFRFAGCHLHFSYRHPTQSEQRLLDGVKMADRLAGVMSVALFRGMEDERRRKYYGLAGEYRRPEYGVEYRTLTPAMLCHPAICHLMLDVTRAAMGLGIQGHLDEWDGSDEEVQACINNLDIDLAVRLVQRNEALLKGIIQGCNNNQDLAMRMIYEGVANLLPVEEVEKNWLFGETWEEHSDDNRADFRHLRIKEKK